MSKEESALYAGLVAILLFFGAVGEAAYEIYHWLRYGFKAGLSVARIVTDYFHNDLIWVYAPKEWVGAAKIVRYVLEMDLWLFFGCLGLIVISYFLSDT